MPDSGVCVLSPTAVDQRCEERTASPSPSLCHRSKMPVGSFKKKTTTNACYTGVNWYLISHLFIYRQIKSIASPLFHSVIRAHHNGQNSMMSGYANVLWYMVNRSIVVSHCASPSHSAGTCAVMDEWCSHCPQEQLCVIYEAGIRSWIECLTPTPGSDSWAGEGVHLVTD